MSQEITLDRADPRHIRVLCGAEHIGTIHKRLDVSAWHWYATSALRDFETMHFSEGGALDAITGAWFNAALGG